jgi:hypothetical protein
MPLDTLEIYNKNKIKWQRPLGESLIGFVFRGIKVITLFCKK